MEEKAKLRISFAVLFYFSIKICGRNGVDTFGFVEDTGKKVF